jgi:hypothetical protein
MTLKKPTAFGLKKTPLQHCRLPLPSVRHSLSSACRPPSSSSYQRCRRHHHHNTTTAAVVILIVTLLPPSAAASEVVLCPILYCIDVCSTYLGEILDFVVVHWSFIFVSHVSRLIVEFI